jgi:hypothetical protein
VLAGRGDAFKFIQTGGVLHSSRNSAAGSGNTCPTSTRSEVEFCSCRRDVSQCVCLPALTCCERLAARARAASRFSSILPWRTVPCMHAECSFVRACMHAALVNFRACEFSSHPPLIFSHTPSSHPPSHPPSLPPTFPPSHPLSLWQ